MPGVLPSDRLREESLRRLVGGAKGVGWLFVALAGVAYSWMMLAWAAPALVGTVAAVAAGREPRSVLGVTALVVYVAMYVGYGTWFWLRVLRRRDPFLDWWCGGETGAPPESTPRPVGLMTPAAVFLLGLAASPERPPVFATVALMGAAAVGWSVVATRRTAPQSPASDQWAVPAAWLVQSTSLHAALVFGLGATVLAVPTYVFFELVPVGVFYFADLDRHWMTAGPLSYALEATLLAGGAVALAGGWFARVRVLGIGMTAVGALMVVAAAVATVDRVRLRDGDVE